MLKNTVSERHFQNAVRAFLVAGALLFSFFLMFHTFSYNTDKKELRIASKAWSDFGAHIPLIRSFSYGANFSRLFHGQPIESPLFPGEPIRYHFGFYAFVGILERLGVRIDWAFNIPSALGFFALLLSIYVVSKQLFHREGIALLSVLFFLLNGSLSFLKFFTIHPFSRTTLTDIVTNSKFPSFGPWDGGDITAFWNLNIYTNQRHLALSYAMVLCLLFLVRREKKTIITAILCGGILGTLFFVNYAAAGIALLLLGWIFLVERQLRKSIFTIAGIAVLPFFWLLHSANVHSVVTFDPGYLMHTPKTVESFFRFWFANLGFHLFFIPLGILVSPRPIRRLLLPPLLLLFILPNLFRFSPDMINNHKFFNFFLIFGNMFTAVFLAFLAKKVASVTGLVHLGKALVILLIIPLTLSGIIDFFPIVNDYAGGISDLRNNPDARFIMEHTSPGDIVANSTWFYHPASLVGRPVYSGYTYFTWSYGYDDRRRESALLGIYRSQTKEDLCKTLTTDGVSMVELDAHPESYIAPNMSLWDSILPSYENPETHRKLYIRSYLCADEL